jgi:transposase-like protein
MTPPHCPICEKAMRDPMEHNALSRYVRDTYICSECGRTEAISRFFWKERAYALGLGDKIKPEYI